MQDAALTVRVRGSATGVVVNRAVRCLSRSLRQDGRIAVSTPYHPNFPARARMLGGEWDAARRVWMFDADDVARVRRLCQEIYGADGSEGAAPFPNPAGHGRNEFADAATAPHYFGHRERLLAAGTENFADYELLEVILFAARPRGDVKPVAKALIEHFLRACPSRGRSAR
jgi:hypothetical protein